MIEGTLEITISNQVITPEVPIYKNIAPIGWHIGNDTEWFQLFTDLGGITVAGGKMKLPGTILWMPPNTGANNSSGFSARAAGARDAITGEFSVTNKQQASWWSVTDFVTSAREISITYNSTYIFTGAVDFKYGLNLRAFKDDPLDWQEGDTVIDIDGNIYATCKIGNQVVTVGNLKVTRFNDGTPLPVIEDDAEWISQTKAAMCWYKNTPA